MSWIKTMNLRVQVSKRGSEYWAEVTSLDDSPHVTWDGGGFATEEEAHAAAMGIVEDAIDALPDRPAEEID